MQYMGSKRRIAKHILPIILADRYPGQWYVEPFMGGCNSLQHVDWPTIGADVHPELVALFQAVQGGWVPPDTVSLKDYQQAQNSKDVFSPALRGFIGFGCSFGSKWFGGYARHKYDSATRSSCLENKRSLLRQMGRLKHVQFQCAPYWELDIPDDSIIYCDPPYAGTTKYRDAFDHEFFWQWCDAATEAGHTVFVSEYSAPANWTPVWAATTVAPGISPTNTSHGTEKLFQPKART